MAVIKTSRRAPAWMVQECPAPAALAEDRRVLLLQYDNLVLMPAADFAAWMTEVQAVCNIALDHLKPEE